MKKPVIVVDKKLDRLPETPIFKKKYENAQAFLATLKPKKK